MTAARDGERAGADSLVELLRFMSEAATAPAYDLDDQFDGDSRNYPALVAEVTRRLEANFIRAETDHRQGFVRGLTDLLVTLVDGFVVPFDDDDEQWDPLASYAPSFAARRGARRDIERGRLSAMGEEGPALKVCGLPRGATAKLRFRRSR